MAASTPSHTLADDGLKNASFEKFRSQLLEALKRHDKKYIEEIMSPEIEMALGGGKGKKAFAQRWENLSEASPFWGRMQKVLSHGAQFDQESDEFHAPAVSFEDSHSELPQCIAWNKSSPLRKKPSSTSPPVKNLYNEQLTLMEPAEPGPVTSSWVKVQTNDGAVGFMETNDIYSAYDEFAVFKKRQDKWCLGWFGFAGL